MSADTPKLLTRALAVELAERVEAVAQLIKAELPQLEGVGIFGSYLSNAPMIGDLDVAFEIRAMSPDELKAFCQRHPSPSRENIDRWPEVWCLRQLRKTSIFTHVVAWRALRPGAPTLLLDIDGGQKQRVEGAAA